MKKNRLTTISIVLFLFSSAIDLSGQITTASNLEFLNAPVLFKEGNKYFQQVVASYLSEKQGDILIVALESDEFIKRIKQRNPVHNQKQRALILASFVMVDRVVCLPDFKDEQEYFDLVLKTKPNIVAVTKGDNKLINKKRQAEIIGAKVVIVTEKIMGSSSYSIINSTKNK